MSLRLTIYKVIRGIYRCCPVWLKNGLLKTMSLKLVFRNVYYTIDSKIFSKKATFYCPCCDYHFRSFKSNPYTMRTDYFNPERYIGIEQKVICPVCGSLPRHRILATWMNTHKLEGNVLYFAKEGSISRWLKRNGVKTTSADLYGQADLKLDIQDTCLPENSWDWVINNHVLEHVNDYQKALKELHRIMKPGGHMIISFPIDETLESVLENREADEKERIKIFGQIDHWRLFGRDSDAILKNAGFRVSKIQGDGLPESIKPFTGPANYDVNYLYLCEKQ